MYELEGELFSMLTEGLFWCLFYYLWGNEGNNHQTKLEWEEEKLFIMAVHVFTLRGCSRARIVLCFGEFELLNRWQIFIDSLKY